MTGRKQAALRSIAAAAAFAIMPLVAQAAEDEACYVPPFLAEPNSSLERVAEAVKHERRLSLVIVSGSPSQVGGSGGRRSYPSYLEGALRERLPDIDLKVDVRAKSRQSASELLARLPTIIEETKPTLVIWQIGTVDALRQTDIDLFSETLKQGIAAINAGGADAILLDMQFSPRTDRLVDNASYLGAIRDAAEAAEVPLFERYEIMQYWDVAGTFDLSSLKDDGLYEKVHACIGEVLADFLLRGAGLSKNGGLGG
jgi:hypothetical protein